MSAFLTAKDLKDQASIVDFLAKLGFKPVRKSVKEHFYYSMLRTDDKDLSFSVDDMLGVWFDHGTRKGGNIIDLAMAYWKNLDFNEAVLKLSEVYSMNASENNFRRPRSPVKIPHYIVEEIKDLGTHPAITDYLKNRGVFQMAKGCLSEVYYYVEIPNSGRKHFFAAGWKNENGGWEVRNKYFKGCLGHTALTFIENDKKNLAVFEGFINFLSWKAEHPHAGQSVLILNRLTLLKIGIEKAKAFSNIDLYLDRDHSGHQATIDFIKALPYASDRSHAYLGFNDYNDKLVAGRVAEKPKSAIFM